MFITFLVLGGIVIAVLGASVAVLTVGQVKKNKAASLEAGEEPAEEPVAEEPAEEPVAEEPAEEPVAEEPAEEDSEEPAEEDSEEPAEEDSEESDAEDFEEEPEDGEGNGNVAAIAAGVAAGAGIAVIAGGAGETGAEGYDRRGKIMHAYEMSSAMREIVGCVGDIYDERIYRVTFSYSFQARLTLADEETRNFYNDFAEEVSHFKKIKLRQSRRQMRIGIGRDRIGVIYFKGQKLCVAYALSRDEVDYDALKIKDMSEKARFAETPAMLCLTSGLKCRRAKMLLNRIAEKYGVARKDESSYEPEPLVSDRETDREKINDKLYRSGDIKIFATLIQSSPAEANR